MWKVSLRSNKNWFAERDEISIQTEISMIEIPIAASPELRSTFLNEILWELIVIR